MTKGQIVGGEFNNIILRQKSDAEIEIGELLVADTPNGKLLMQVFDLQFGSQISRQNLELISGMTLEDNADMSIIDEKVRNYNLAYLKNLISIKNNQATLSKSLPLFFSQVREIKEQDLAFLTKPQSPLFLGNLRSGTKQLDFEVFLQGDKVFSHHILIPATTGRGKSNLTSCMLWDSVDKDYCGILVLDPHDEYYGRTGLGLKDHPNKENLTYYTAKNPPPGTNTLKINLELIRPQHLNGVLSFTDPQHQLLNAYYKTYKEKWIEGLVKSSPLTQGYDFAEGTMMVVRRKLMSLFSLSITEDRLVCNSIFDNHSGQSTISDIINELQKSKTVIIDTSQFPGHVEILVGSLIASDIFDKYKKSKIKGDLDQKPVISIVLEEAPRVLGKEVLEKGTNIFETIAREGRKFKIGLTAITQLPSLIPKQILANMNTKIILGIEMKTERQAIIESASQDLSTDNRNIASLDKGEAIITSNFSKFAMPVKIPLFKEFASKTKKQEKKSFPGVNF